MLSSPSAESLLILRCALAFDGAEVDELGFLVSSSASPIVTSSSAVFFGGLAFFLFHISLREDCCGGAGLLMGTNLLSVSCRCTMAVDGGFRIERMDNAVQNRIDRKLTCVVRCLSAAPSNGYFGTGAAFYTLSAAYVCWAERAGGWPIQALTPNESRKALSQPFANRTRFENFVNQGYTLCVTVSEVSAFGSLSRMLEVIVRVFFAHRSYLQKEGLMLFIRLT